MLETIDARASTRYPPRGTSAWHYRRSARGGVSFTHPDPPEGVSLCSYSRTPSGEHRVRVEGNLTTLVHGSDRAHLSLREDEIPDAVEAYMDAVSALLPGAHVPRPRGWDLHRLDPSTTYLLPDDMPTALVIDAAFRAFNGAANGRQVVTRHNSETVTYRLSKWRSWTVYDKAAETVKKLPGVPVPANLVRMEARVRPRNGTGDWKASQPTLEDVDLLANKAASESMAMLSTVANYMGATGTLALVQLLVKGGAPLNAALRLASVADLSETFGDNIFDDMGAAPSSVRRWKADVRKYLEAAGGEEALKAALPGLLATVTPAFAAEFTVSRREPS